MSSSYEIWITDDAGRRISLMKNYSSIYYSRTNAGYGTCQLIVPFNKYIKDIGALPRPDMRIDVWRSPESGIPIRREGSFLIRKFTIYQRKTDNVRVIEILGRSPLDILRRQTNHALVGNLYGYIDELMKSIVRSTLVDIPSSYAYSTTPVTVQDGFYTSTGEFGVDDFDFSGPLVVFNAGMKNALDILKDLKSTSFTLNEQDSANRKIYFDVIEDESLGLPGGFGYRFRTYADLRGKDRTNGISFSTENGNIQVPVYYEDYLDEITSIFHYNSAEAWSPQGAQSPDRYLSRWNCIDERITTTETDVDADLVKIQGELRDSGAQKVFSCDFLNSPGSDTQPRSLYGADWDMGDLLPVKFAGKVMNAEVVIV